MKVIIKTDYQEISQEAARIVAAQVLSKPNSVLGLPTGETPIGMYEKLIQMCKFGLIDFSRGVTFNLDEYCGLPHDHPNSYHRYMHEHFFDHINIHPENTFILDGTVEDISAECCRYEKRIQQLNGIDLQVLGIGTNGHIGFNEPGVDWGMTVGLVTLSEETRRREARHFRDPTKTVPTQALTMGIKTIMRSRRILLLASGEEKAMATKKAIEGPITKEVPAAVLQLHPDVTVILDRKAASRLELPAQGA
jgi:glucosamine-6-phosphate deaminase